MITLCSHFNQAFFFFFFWLRRASASPRAALKQRRVETCSTNPATRWSVAQSAFPLRPAICLPLSPLRGEESQGKGCYFNFSLPPDAAAQRCTHSHTSSDSTQRREFIHRNCVFIHDFKKYAFNLSVCANRDKILRYLCYFILPSSSIHLKVKTSHWLRWSGFWISLYQIL